MAFSSLSPRRRTKADGQPKQHRSRTPAHSKNDDDSKRRKQVRVKQGRPMKRPLRQAIPLSRSNGGSSRTVLATAIMLLIAAVGMGIILLVFRFLSPFQPEPIYAIVEKSKYRYQPEIISSSISYNNDTDIVLGKRPSPERNIYESSLLEEYVLTNGRDMGYDKEVINNNDQVSHPTKQETFRFPSSIKDVTTSSLAATSLFRHLPMLFPNRNNQNRKSRINWWDTQNSALMPSGCDLWTTPEATNQQVYQHLQTFRNELEAYELSMEDWCWNYDIGNNQTHSSDNSVFWGAWNHLLSGNNNNNKINNNIDRDYFRGKVLGNSQKHPDLRDYLRHDDDGTKAVCDSLKIHPDGLEGIFTSPVALSRFENHYETKDDESVIFLEPLLPPLRHPEFCYAWTELRNLEEYHKYSYADTDYASRYEEVAKNTRLLDVGYIIHDFANTCKHRLHAHSRTVFIDLGASFEFHQKESSDPPPELQILNLYQKFGFRFDHIYGYEITPQDPNNVYDAIPDSFRAAYHWFNVGVDANRTSPKNPFRMIEENYTPDDFVVVKLDIDTPALEAQLASQLLEEAEEENESNDEESPKTNQRHKLSDLIDVFYFEHHVSMKELAPSWGHSMRGSMQDSIEFYASLREHGIAAHYWV